MEDPDKAVILAADEKYLPYALCLCWQIAVSSGERDFDILLVTECALEVPQSLRQLGIKTMQVQIGSAYSRKDPRGHVSRAAYLRLNAFDELAKTYRRLLYLDCDILFETGDISRLLDLDLKGAAIGAVCDVKAFVKRSWHAKDFRLAGMGPAPYLNSGVLLVDCAAYTAQNISDRAKEVVERHSSTFVYHDQSILNLTLHGDFAELSPVWNWQMNLRLGVAPHDVQMPVAFRHFITVKKPFRPEGAPHHLRYSEIYRSFFRTYLPEAVNRLPPRPPRQRFLALGEELALLGKKFIHARSAQAYLSRFPDEWTVQRHVPGTWTRIIDTAGKSGSSTRASAAAT